MQNSDYDFIREYLKKLSGIELGSDRQFLVESRLGPVLQDFKLGDFADLVRQLRGAPLASLDQALLTALTTNESLFFRDKTPFNTMEKTVLPYLLNKRSEKKIRIWSAACSTGQEAYSILMSMFDAYPQFTDWDIKVFASDISPKVLLQARKGWYTDFEMDRGVDSYRREKYFRRENGGWQIDDRLRSLVTFEEVNLARHPFRVGPFDVVFCRNVIIYFDADLKARVLEEVGRTMVEDGFLFLGGSESNIGLTDRLKSYPGIPHLLVKNLP